LSAEVTKTHSFRLFFWRFCPLGEHKSEAKYGKKWNKYSEQKILFTAEADQLRRWAKKEIIFWERLHL